MFRRTKALPDFQDANKVKEYNVEMLAKDYMNSPGETYLSKGKLPRDVQVLLLGFILGKDMQPESQAIEDARLAESVRTHSPFKA